MFGLGITIWITSLLGGGLGGGGPFLLLVSGSPSKLRLQNGTSRLLITGANSVASEPFPIIF